MTLEDKIKDIRTQLRLAMNGVVSHSMRQKGVNYRLNFGGAQYPTARIVFWAFEILLAR